MNEGIAKELASLSYMSVDEVVLRVLQLRRAVLMAKMDISRLIGISQSIQLTITYWGGKDSHGHNTAIRAMVGSHDILGNGGCLVLDNAAKRCELACPLCG